MLDNLTDVIEIGTKESALYTLFNIDRITQDLKEVRKHVRSTDKHRIDNSTVILKVIAFEIKKTFAISDYELEVFIKKLKVPNR